MSRIDKPSKSGGVVLELLLSLIAFLLFLIFLQLRKNIKEIDRYFAAFDLSLRQFLANLSSTEKDTSDQRHKEICNHLSDISSRSLSALTLLKKEHDFESVEDQYEKNKPQWLPSPKAID